MTDKVRLDRGGIAALLKSGPMAELVASAAADVADSVRGLGIQVDGVPGKYDLPVEVSTYTTDRAAASVAIAHPSGVAVQAKHGALSKGASAAGLQVKGY